MEQSASRLRKTFHYPTEDDSDDPLPVAMDEEEQETLIKTLTSTNKSHNETYIRLFLLLPLATSTLYLSSLFNPRTSLLSLMALSSLSTSAWTLYALPVSRTGFPALDGWNSPSRKEGTWKGVDGRGGMGMGMQMLGQRIDKSPLELYLPVMNLGLVALLAVGDFLLEEGIAWAGFGVVPGIVYGVVVVVKLVMGSVDVGELEGLRYSYKGA